MAASASSRPSRSPIAAAPIATPTLAVVRGSGTVGSIWIDPAGFAGATSSPEASCTFNVNFDSGGGQLGPSQWSVGINAGNAGAPIALPVTGTATAGICP